MWEVNDTIALNIELIVSNGVSNEIESMFLRIFWFLTTFGLLNMHWVTLTQEHYGCPWQMHITGGF